MGSFRQRRADALRLVVEAQRPLVDLDDEAVRSLERDGLVVVADGLVSLPTRPIAARGVHPRASSVPPA